jgi:hypothetical protein
MMAIFPTSVIPALEPESQTARSKSAPQKLFAFLGKNYIFSVE